MARATVVIVFAASIAVAGAATVSPIAKIVELLDECKAKTQADLDEEAKGMEKYTQFCDDEANDKKYAIDTAERQIEDLSATIEDSTATISALADEIEELSLDISEHQKDLDKETKDRNEDHATFVDAEKEMLTQIDMLSSAIKLLEEGGAAFLQQSSGKSWSKAVVQAITAISAAQGVETSSKEQLQSFIETAKKAAAAPNDNDDSEEDEDEDKMLALSQQMTGQPQPNKQVFQSQSGAIIKTLAGIQESTEARLSDTRKKEMEDSFSFDKIKQGLEQEISHANDKLSTATSSKAAAQQALEEANEKKTDTTNSKAADEEYKTTLATECQTKATEWEERLRSGNGEIAAIEKAKAILREGVKVFAQVRTRTRRTTDLGDEGTRARLTASLRNLAADRHSFALNQLVVSAKNDPFGKVRGLIEDMIGKLMKEAEEAATKHAFCEEEMGKNEKSKADKTAEMDKQKVRMDTDATQIAELTQASAALEAEIAETDKAQAEATELRQSERATYNKASKDYREAAEAVARAIEVLKSYYEGAFIQVSAHSHRELKAGQPSFGGAQDSSGIISIMELAQEDFTTQLAEIESEESEAKTAYEKMTSENEISQATKKAELKGKASEIKSLKVGLSHNTEDYESVSKELDTVLAYLAKLKPECQQKVPSYEEVKAAREAEIAGLKEGLEILSDSAPSLLQTHRRLRIAHHA